MESDVKILGKGVYSIGEASKLTRLRTQKVNEWFRGRNSPTRIFKAVFESDYPILHEQYAISFLDLIELKIAGTLREMGVSLPKIRKVYQTLRQESGEHPFCTRQIYVGGKQIFTRGLDEKESNNVIEILTKQIYFETIILPFLKSVDYDESTNRAARWHIADLVVVDPEYHFGKPIIEETGMATSILRNSYYANDEDAKIVANWFGVAERHVLAAVRFEDSFAA